MQYSDTRTHRSITMEDLPCSTGSSAKRNKLAHLWCEKGQTYVNHKEYRSAFKAYVNAYRYSKNCASLALSAARVAYEANYLNEASKYCKIASGRGNSQIVCLALLLRIHILATRYKRKEIPADGLLEQMTAYVKLAIMSDPKNTVAIEKFVTLKQGYLVYENIETPIGSKSVLLADHTRIEVIGT